MIRAFSRPSSGAHDCSSSLWFYLRIVVTVVLCSWSGRPARPQTQHDCHHVMVGPAGPTTNTAQLSPRYEGKTRGCYCSHEPLMMGGRMPETCWAVRKRQNNKLENCCTWLVIYLNFNNDWLLYVIFVDLQSVSPCFILLNIINKTLKLSSL
jgi:hypothetical protein